MESINSDFSREYRIPFNMEDKWKEYLKTNGFVVISDFLTSEKCESYVKEMLSVIQILSKGKFKKDDKNTWTKSANMPYMLHGGMIQYVGHSQFQWDLRAECSEIFAKVWETAKTDLATSFDGFCFMSGEKSYKKKFDNSFLHTDQSPNKNALWSYQGLINLIDCGSSAGGFVCVPKSNLLHRKYFEDRYKLDDPKFKGNWYLFTDEEKEKEQILNDTIKVNCMAGDFILWDSRTFHCNQTPTDKTSRACVYICMLPKSHVTKNIVEKREKAFEGKRCTGHHPGDGFKMFPKLPRFCKPSELQPLVDKVQKKVSLTDLQISLAHIS
jgi:ectoine hydroxylase-related dioxygenase (phytanoyl-CoA dioxygenase family)